MNYRLLLEYKEVKKNPGKKIKEECQESFISPGMLIFFQNYIWKQEMEI